MKVSIVVPFYNTPKKHFKECIKALQKINPFEVILVDDCSTDKDTIRTAIDSGFNYLKTPHQSGFDGLPFNIGVANAKGNYICRVDSDDILLALPKKFTTDFCFGNLDRVKTPYNLTLEELILAPRAICNALVGKTELFKRYPMAHDNNVYGDVLFVLRTLYNKHTFSVPDKVNYIYRDCEDSIQTSKPAFHHRMRHVQTVARFCQLENIPPKQAIHFLNLAMLNTRYGSKAMKALAKNKDKEC